MRITFALFFMALLAACSTAQREDPAPAPQQTAVKPAAVPPLPGNWLEWPIALGNWVYRRDGRGSIALFGEAGRDALFMIRCDLGRQSLYLSRAGRPKAEIAKMTLRASSGLKSFEARNSGGERPYAAIAVAPADYMLDRIAYSRGRFAVETEGMRSIALPIWPEFTRVVEDCRGASQ